MNRRAGQKPEGQRVKRKRPVYLRATSLPECRSRGVAKAVPEFHLPAQLADPVNVNRRTVGKRGRVHGVWEKAENPASGLTENTMKTVEVDEKKWSQFCQRIEEYCRGANVTVELDPGSGSKTTVIEDSPLRHLTFDEHADPCNANLVIEVGAPDSKPIRHLVVEPIRILLRDGKDTQRYHRIEVMAENGTTTVELRPGLDQALLKGLEL